MRSHGWRTRTTDQGRMPIKRKGHDARHFVLSQKCNKKELEHISRQGTCTACHQNISEDSLAVSLLHHVAQYTGQLPKTSDQHDSLVNKIVLSSAWAQVGGDFLFGMLTFGLAGRYGYRRRQKKK